MQVLCLRDFSWSRSGCSVDAFLESLTSPGVDDLVELAPEAVPSGLPVDGVGDAP